VALVWLAPSTLKVLITKSRVGGGIVGRVTGLKGSRALRVAAAVGVAAGVGAARRLGEFRPPGAWVAEGVGDAAPAGVRVGVGVVEAVAGVLTGLPVREVPSGETCTR
jgi:hypothetical protein